MGANVVVVSVIGRCRQCHWALSMGADVAGVSVDGQCR
jgi:hypothetical protein